MSAASRPVPPVKAALAQMLHTETATLYLASLGLLTLPQDLTEEDFVHQANKAYWRDTHAKQDYLPYIGTRFSEFAVTARGIIATLDLQNPEAVEKYKEKFQAQIHRLRISRKLRALSRTALVKDIDPNQLVGLLRDEIGTTEPQVLTGTSFLTQGIPKLNVVHSDFWYFVEYFSMRAVPAGVHIISGEPGSGKSTTSLLLALRLMKNNPKIKLYVVTMEMASSIYMIKALSMVTKVPLIKLESEAVGALPPDDPGGWIDKAKAYVMQNEVAHSIMERIYTLENVNEVDSVLEHMVAFMEGNPDSEFIFIVDHAGLLRENRSLDTAQAAPAVNFTAQAIHLAHKYPMVIFLIAQKRKEAPGAQAIESIDRIAGSHMIPANAESAFSLTRYQENTVKLTPLKIRHLNRMGVLYIRREITVEHKTGQLQENWKFWYEALD